MYENSTYEGKCTVHASHLPLTCAHLAFLVFSSPVCSTTRMEVPRGRAPERLPGLFPAPSAFGKAEQQGAQMKESCQPFTFHSEITLNPYPDCTEEDWKQAESLHFGVRI